MIPFDPAKPAVAFGCALPVNRCGMMFVRQPKSATVTSEPLPTWCSRCGDMQRVEPVVQLAFEPGEEFVP